MCTLMLYYRVLSAKRAMELFFWKNVENRVFFTWKSVENTLFFT